MKVIVISSTFPPMRSGGSDLVFWLCRRLATAGLAVEVVTTRVDHLATNPAFQVFPLMKNWSWREMPRLLRFLRRRKPDLVYLNFQHEIYRHHPMVTFIPAFLKRLTPAPRVVTHMETPGGMRLRQVPRTVRAVRRAVVRWLNTPGIDYRYGSVLSHSDAVVVGCAAHGQVLEEDLPGVTAKCVVIPMPPNLRLYPGNPADARKRGRELLGVPADGPVIAFYGYLYPTKGLETLIRAFALLAARRPTLRLLVIGGDNQVALRKYDRPAYVAELQELAQAEGVADRVTWTGYCPQENDLGSLYLHSADLCALPFDMGLYPNNSSFTAAAAHGLAIVSTKGASVEAPLVDGENVLLCQPKDPQDLARAAERVLADAELRRRLGAGALALANGPFSWETLLARTLDVFGAVTG
jgi:glycosyltransferase involved in cell wall biosynthesis